MAGMPSAHALGLGDGRLTLPRPICAFFEVVSELWHAATRQSPFQSFSRQPTVPQTVGQLLDDL